MKIVVVVTGELELVHSQEKEGGRTDRILRMGGQYFVKNPKNFPAGRYSEFTMGAEDWGQKGIQPREIITGKPEVGTKVAA